MRYERKSHAAFTTDDYVFAQLIPYIGNKRKLLPLIDRAIASTGVHSGTVVDFFAGSGVVSRYAKRRGFSVIANDWEPYALHLNRCWIEADAPPTFGALGGYDRAIASLNALPPIAGWVTTHLCPDDDEHLDVDRDRMFYTRANGMRIDAIREQIAAWHTSGVVDDLEASCLIAPMLYAACYTANTSGVFKGFHRGWGGQTKTALYRILSRFTLRGAHFIRGKPASVSGLDATTLASALAPVDIAYLDPPYNQHPYASNYHVLNSIALWDKPQTPPKITGRGNKSAIRLDWRTDRRSPYNDRRLAEQAYRELLDAIDARFILTSYSTDGTIELEALLDACIARGATTVLAQPYKRYRVSSQRFSNKPVNLEFVAVIDGSRPHEGESASALGTHLREREAFAVGQHRSLSS